jgi:hypothetical protein
MPTFVQNGRALPIQNRVIMERERERKRKSDLIGNVIVES